MTKAGKFFVSVVIRNDVSQESLDIEVDVKRTSKCNKDAESNLMKKVN